MNENLYYRNEEAIDLIRTEFPEFNVDVSESSIFKNSLYYFLIKRNVKEIKIKENWTDRATVNVTKDVESWGCKPFSLYIYYTREECKAKISDVFDKHEVLSGFIGAETYRTKDLSTIILICNQDEMQTQLAKATLMIPLLFEGIFKEHPIEDIEKEFLMSIRSKEGDVYISELKKFYKKFSDEAAFTVLKNFGGDYIKNKIRENEARISNCRRDMESYYKGLQDLNREIMEAMVENEAFISTKKDDVNPVYDFFKRSQNLEIIRANKDCITYRVHSTLGNFDPEIAKIEMKKSDSFFYRDKFDVNLRITENVKSYCNLSDEDMKKFYTAIFLNEEYKIRILSTFELRSSRLEAPNNWAYSKEERANSIVNWHVQKYSCLGENLSLINEAFERRDYVGVVIQTMAVTSNINLSEPSTSTAFFRDIFSDLDKPILVDKENQVISINEAMARINGTTAEEKEITEEVIKNGEPD